MDVVTSGTAPGPGHDFDFDPDFEGDGSTGAPPSGRWARHLENRRRLRRRVALGLAAAGVVAIVAGLSWDPGRTNSAEPVPVDVVEGGVTENTAMEPTDNPGGVGQNPEKTGLPAVPAEGGRVRSGTEGEGCFSTMREYLDAWDRTGEEPDPCFLPQEPADQSQPDGVVRSYNGEKF